MTDENTPEKNGARSLRYMRANVYNLQRSDSMILRELVEVLRHLDQRLSVLEAHVFSRDGSGHDDGAIP